jgi:hypothetical protein
MSTARTLSLSNRSAAALGAALVALGLVGCGGGASPSSSSPSSSDAPAAASAATRDRPAGARVGHTIYVDGVPLTLPVPGAAALDRAPTLPGGPPPEPRPVDVVTVVPVGGGHPSLAPPADEPPAPEAPSRSRRRMDLEQLEAAFVAATGGLTWTENGVSQWQALAPTLGRPDFLTVTDEDLTPSPLFQKFLGDAARKVCSDLFVREASTPPLRRVFFVGLTADEPSARLGARLDANLQRLLLRFHGRDTRAPGTAGALDGWRWLWLSAEHVEGPRAAWMATCVALIEHPDFYTY